MFARICDQDQGCKPFSEEFDVQLAERFAESRAVLALDISLRFTVEQAIGKLLAMAVVFFILGLIYRYSLRLTQNLKQGSTFKSRSVKTLFVILALTPWVGMYVYIKYFS